MAVVTDDTVSDEGGGSGDFLEQDWDVIERQTLGGDAQDLSFAIVGATDELVEIEGAGPCSAAGTHNITLLVNGATTNISQQTNLQGDGGASGSLAAQNDGTRIITVSTAEWLYFRLQFLTKILATGPRGGFGHAWTGAVTPRNVYHLFSATYNDTSTAITSIALRSSRADGFKSGFIAIARRRKITA
jgi:hypothetical protein